jgi:hypothetical protein
VVGEIIV